MAIVRTCIRIVHRFLVLFCTIFFGRARAVPMAGRLTRGCIRVIRYLLVVCLLGVLVAPGVHGATYSRLSVLPRDVDSPDTALPQHAYDPRFELDFGVPVHGVLLHPAGAPTPGSSRPDAYELITLFAACRQIILACGIPPRLAVAVALFAWVGAVSFAIRSRFLARFAESFAQPGKRYGFQLQPMFVREGERTIHWYHRCCGFGISRPHAPRYIKPSPLLPWRAWCCGYAPSHAFDAQRYLPQYRWWRTRISYRRLPIVALTTYLVYCLLVWPLVAIYDAVDSPLEAFFLFYLQPPREDFSIFYLERLIVRCTVFIAHSVGIVVAFVGMWRLVCTFLPQLSTFVRVFYDGRPFFSEEKASQYSMLRSSFRRLLVDKPMDLSKTTHHSHPIAAAERDAADNSINNWITLQGMSPFSIQMSLRDVTRGLEGSLLHLWPRDRHSAERYDHLMDHHLIKLVNVDYYVDWKELLWMARPFVLYTFTPVDPAGVTPNISWSVDENDYIDMRVTGGSHYHHQLWDYECDGFSARYPGVTVHYDVEKIPVSENWSIVFIAPRSIEGNNQFGTDIGLKRRTFVHTVVNMFGVTRKIAILRHVGRVSVVNKEGKTHYEHGMMSIALPGSLGSVRLSSKLQAILDGRIHCTTMPKISLSDLIPICLAEYQTDDVRVQQALIAAGYPCNADVLRNINTVSIWDAKEVDVTYRAPTKEGVLGPVETAPVTIIANPILPITMIPTRSKANDEWCIDARLEQVRNRQKQFAPKYTFWSTELWNGYCRALAD